MSFAFSRHTSAIRTGTLFITVLRLADDIILSNSAPALMRRNQEDPEDTYYEDGTGKARLCYGEPRLLTSRSRGLAMAWLQPILPPGKSSAKGDEGNGQREYISVYAPDSPCNSDCGAGLSQQWWVTSSPSSPPSQALCTNILQNPSRFFRHITSLFHQTPSRDVTSTGR